MASARIGGFALLLALAGGDVAATPPGRVARHVPDRPHSPRSNITLSVDAGATLKFSADFDDYLPMVRSRWEGTEVVNVSPQIYGDKVENVALVGRGTIDGNGKPWWDYFSCISS